MDSTIEIKLNIPIEDMELGNQDPAKKKPWRIFKASQVVNL